jgi:hypothetical protein
VRTAILMRIYAFMSASLMMTSLQSHAAPSILKYTNNNKTYELRAEAKKGAEPYGVEIHYSIGDGKKKFTTWEKKSQFVLQTCSERGLPKQFSSIASDEKGSLGFFVYGGCGNPYLANYHFVRVTGDNSPEVKIVELRSKVQPVIRPSTSSDFTEIWTLDQLHPNAVGTSSSIFVPSVYRFRRSGQYLSYKDQILPEKINSWPRFEYAEAFPSFYAAGLRMMNDDVLTQAIDLYFNPKDAEMYGEIGLPVSKEEALKVRDAVKVLKAYSLNYPPKLIQ